MANIKKYKVDCFENIENSKQALLVNKLHKQRIAFLIIDNKVLYLKNSEMTHYEWAVSLGINDNIFNTLTRGFIYNNNLVFYKGNFGYDESVINNAKKYAKIIMQNCKQKMADVYVGVNIGKIGDNWKPKQYLFSLNI